MGDQETEDSAADGNDTITLTGLASSGAHTIKGGAGKDTITTAAGNGDELIDGGSGADSISGKAGQDTIFGRAGADIINIEGENTAGTSRIVRAGADNDKIIFDNLAFAQLNINDTYAGENGTDTIALIGAIADYDMSAVGSVDATSLDNVTAETFAYGSASTNEATLAGDFTHTFSAQAQTSGFRTFDATHTTTSLATTHRVLNISAAAYTSAAGVTMSGSADKDVIVNLIGGSGADTLNDGAASDGAVDSLTGGAGIDTFNVSATTASTAIRDLGIGGVSDIFTVSAAANGAEILVKGDYVATAATFNNKSLAAVTLTVDNGIDVNMTAATGNFGFDIDGGTTASTLSGSAKADSINGGAAADNLVGNAGNDSIDGEGGADTIAGGAGNDQITAGAGSDSADGGAGNDTFVVATGDAAAGDTVIGGTGTDSFTIANGTADWAGTFDFDNISDVTTLATSGLGTGTNEHVTVTFSAIAETTAQTITLTSASITDTDADLVITNSAASATTKFNITGSVGADSLNGSEGDDTLTGGDGADVIAGGAGNDTIALTEANAAIDTVNFIGATGLALAGSLARVTTLGSDTITGFVTANDLFAFSVTDFGTVDAVGAVAENQVGVLANMSTAINSADGQIDGIGIVATTAGAFVVIGANGGATTDSLFFVLAGATATDTMTEAIADSKAVQIGSIVNGTVALADFTMIA
jgi:Ca2+-binding RTX toxin-like protein